MLDSATSFLMGFNYGQRDGALELTARQIGANWRTVDVDAFAQGMLDGLRNDRFRVDLTLARGRSPVVTLAA